MHTRRGDFVGSPNAHSTEEFTLRATKFIVSKGSRPKKFSASELSLKKNPNEVVNVFLIGDDEGWLTALAKVSKLYWRFSQSMNSLALFWATPIFRPGAQRPRHFDCVVSGLYCDAVLLTGETAEGKHGVQQALPHTAGGLPTCRKDKKFTTISALVRKSSRAVSDNESTENTSPKTGYLCICQ